MRVGESLWSLPLVRPRVLRLFDATKILVYHLLLGIPLSNSAMALTVFYDQLADLAICLQPLVNQKNFYVAMVSLEAFMVVCEVS